MEFNPVRFSQCPKCKGKEGPKGQPGFYYVQSGSNLAVVECSCHKNWVTKTRVYIEATKNNIWTDARSLSYDFDDYKGSNSLKSIKKIQNYLDSYCDADTRGYTLYLHGGGGTQKTHIAQYIGLSIFRMGFKAYYTQMKILNTMLCNPYTVDENEIANRNEFIRRISSSDCLIIDDAFDKNIAPVYSTGTQSPYIESFLRDRIQGTKQGVIFVSRVSPSDIKKNGYSESLQSFIEMNTTAMHTVIEFNDTYNDFPIPSIFKD